VSLFKEEGEQLRINHATNTIDKGLMDGLVCIYFDFVGRLFFIGKWLIISSYNFNYDLLQILEP